MEKLLKPDIVLAISNGAGITKNEAAAVVNSFVEAISDALADNRDVLISSLARLFVKRSGPRSVFNFKTGKRVMSKARLVPRCKISKVFLRELNGE